MKPRLFSTVVLALATLGVAADTQAQVGLSRGTGASGIGYSGSLTGGYSYVAPSYRVGWTGTSYGFGGGYGLSRGYGVYGRSPAYLYTTRAPRLSYIQPGINPVYQFDRTPAFGYSGLPYNYGYYGAGYRSLRTSSLGIGPGYTTLYRGPVYRPYVTASQYVYAPTYYSASYVPLAPSYGAVYGAYGYSAIGSCGY